LIAENLNSVIIADRMGRIEWANASFKNVRIFKIIGRVPGGVTGPESNPE
jgi:hypothetical protein